MSLMRLSEMIPSQSNPERQRPSLSGSPSVSFLEELQEAYDHANSEKVKAVLEHARSEDLLPELSPSSKAVLERLRAGAHDIQKDEWTALCREWRDAGVLTQEEFDSVRADVRLIPIGYRDKNGNFVKYSTPPVLLERLRSLSAWSQAVASGSTEAWVPDDGWTGDPLEYLEWWMSMLERWRNGMAGDDSAHFEDFSPMDGQIASCRKVMELLRRDAPLLTPRS